MDEMHPQHRISCPLKREPLDQFTSTNGPQSPYGLYNLGLGFWIVLSFEDCCLDSPMNPEAVQFGRLILQPPQAFKSEWVIQKLTDTCKDCDFDGPRAFAEVFLETFYNHEWDRINSGVYLDGVYAIECYPNKKPMDPNGVETVFTAFTDVSHPSPSAEDGEFIAETYLDTQPAQPYELRALELLHSQREMLSLDTADPALEPPTAALIAALTESDCSLKEIESLVSATQQTITTYVAHFQSLIAEHGGQLPAQSDYMTPDSLTVRLPLPTKPRNTIIPHVNPDST